MSCKHPQLAHMRFSGELPWWCPDCDQSFATNPRELVYPIPGKRVELIPQPGGFQMLAPGEYGKWKDGTWYGCTPSGEGCNLAAHSITEHEDGTITVSPSIGIGDRSNWDWHGYLEHGIWRLA